MTKEDFVPIELEIPESDNGGASFSRYRRIFAGAHCEKEGTSGKLANGRCKVRFVSGPEGTEDSDRKCLLVFFTWVQHLI